MSIMGRQKSIQPTLIDCDGTYVTKPEELLIIWIIFLAVRYINGGKKYNVRQKIILHILI